MKQIIYISGVAGGILLILRIVGIFVEFSFNRQMLLSGLLLTAICITFSLIYKYLQNQKIKSLLKYYKDKNSQDQAQGAANISHGEKEFEEDNPEKEDGDKDTGEKKPKSGPKGLDPGRASLRTRKAGLVWGGGNIKGATATRGTKRGFIKRR
ncbi:MAG: hypothetical protein R6U58_15205 [Bacteroidales bacterium]